ncbi:MAG TPA: HAMP domain-containing sensor histidine kinase, partial [Gammaproteobacteria bacterium]|nr:HAMP domain-containing sensor histidine kinase [Gammaproteobacteria bacterium]
SHELRTPLTSIRAFSEILSEDPKIDLEERKRFLGIIVSETERLTRLVNQVLDLAKIESGHAVWKSSEVDLNDVIRHSIDASEQLIIDRGGRLELDIPDQPARVMADRDRLMQVMLNLLSNAAKFMAKEAGRVEVKLRRERNMYKVVVSDNGSGIPAKLRPVIFEKFRQGIEGGANPLGTGLGLPISREIIEHFGGRLSVTSPPGKGAIFSFVLPLSTRGAAAPADNPGQEAAS